MCICTAYFALWGWFQAGQTNRQSRDGVSWQEYAIRQASCACGPMFMHFQTRQKCHPDCRRFVVATVWSYCVYVVVQSPRPDLRGLKQFVPFAAWKWQRFTVWANCAEPSQRVMCASDCSAKQTPFPTFRWGIEHIPRAINGPYLCKLPSLTRPKSFPSSIYQPQPKWNISGGRAAVTISTSDSQSTWLITGRPPNLGRRLLFAPVLRQIAIVLVAKQKYGPPPPRRQPLEWHKEKKEILWQRAAGADGWGTWALLKTGRQQHLGASERKSRSRRHFSVGATCRCFL